MTVPGDHHLVAILKEQRADKHTSRRRRRELSRIIDHIETVHLARSEAELRLAAPWHPQPLQDIRSERLR